MITNSLQALRAAVSWRRTCRRYHRRCSKKRRSTRLQKFSSPAVSVSSSSVWVLPSRSRKDHNIDAAICLTKDLNDYTKFSIVAMRGHYNVTGSGQVLGWQYGFPYSVDLSRGFARYNPGETGSIEVLKRQEADAVFVLGSEPGCNTSR